MTKPTDTSPPVYQATPALDEKLEHLFGELRDVENRAVPEFPLTDHVSRKLLDAKPEVSTASARRAAPEYSQYGPPHKLTAGLAAALVAAILLAPAPAIQSPDELYLDILSNNTLLTDDLLVVSPTLLPELNDFDGMFDIPSAVESQQWN